MTYADVRPPEPPSGGGNTTGVDSLRPGAVEALYPNVEIPASGGSEPSVPVRPRLSEETPCEEHTAKVKTTPTKPSSAEVATRLLTVLLGAGVKSVLRRVRAKIRTRAASTETRNPDS